MRIYHVAYVYNTGRYKKACWQVLYCMGQHRIMIFMTQSAWKLPLLEGRETNDSFSYKHIVYWYKLRINLTVS